MADCMVLAYLDHHWSDLLATRTCIALSWKHRPMPGLQVKYIYLHVRTCVVCLAIAWTIHQHVGLVFYDSHATTELRLWKAPSGASVLPMLLLDVKAP